jgi:hypothetical protein
MEMDEIGKKLVKVFAIQQLEDEVNKISLKIVQDSFIDQSNKIIDIMEKMQEVYDVYVYETEALIDEFKQIIGD